MSPIILEIKDVWARYKNSGLVLEAVNLELAHKKIMAIVGPNAGGKTTLLKVILGIKKCEKGQVRVMGKPPEAARQEMGFLPQVSTFRRDFPVTALDVVLMGRYGRIGLFRRPGSGDRQKAMQMLAQVGMEEAASKPFRELSGGQQQRVGIARALASEPRLLLLDEPASGVDIVAQEGFYRFLERLRDESGLSVIIVSHDIGVIAPIVDSVALLNRRLHYYGDPKGALNREALEKTFGSDVRLLVHDDEQCITCRESPPES